jgi:hypothetical protein
MVRASVSARDKIVSLALAMTEAALFHLSLLPFHAFHVCRFTFSDCFAGARNDGGFVSRFTFDVSRFHCITYSTEFTTALAIGGMLAVI